MNNLIPQETINEVKNRLVKVYDPLAIYVFGSYAWGQPHEDSDLDLLVIIEKSDEKPQRRPVPGILAMWGLCISKDIIVYTQKEIDERSNNPTSLIYKILRDGKALYVKP